MLTVIDDDDDDDICVLENIEPITRNKRKIDDSNKSKYFEVKKGSFKRFRSDNSLISSQNKNFENCSKCEKNFSISLIHQIQQHFINCYEFVEEKLRSDKCYFCKKEFKRCHIFRRHLFICQDKYRMKMEKQEKRKLKKKKQVKMNENLLDSKELEIYLEKRHECIIPPYHRNPSGNSSNFSQTKYSQLNSMNGDQLNECLQNNDYYQLFNIPILSKQFIEVTSKYFQAEKYKNFNETYRMMTDETFLFYECCELDNVELINKNSNDESTNIKLLDDKQSISNEQTKWKIEETDRLNISNKDEKENEKDLLIQKDGTSENKERIEKNEKHNVHVIPTVNVSQLKFIEVHPSSSSKKNVQQINENELDDIIIDSDDSVDLFEQSIYSPISFKRFCNSKRISNDLDVVIECDEEDGSQSEKIKEIENDNKNVGNPIVISLDDECIPLDDRIVERHYHHIVDDDDDIIHLNELVNNKLQSTTGIYLELPSIRDTSNQSIDIEEVIEEEKQTNILTKDNILPPSLISNENNISFKQIMNDNDDDIIILSDSDGEEIQLKSSNTPNNILNDWNDVEHYHFNDCLDDYQEIMETSYYSAQNYHVDTDIASLDDDTEHDKVLIETDENLENHVDMEENGMNRTHYYEVDDCLISSEFTRTPYRKKGNGVRENLSIMSPFTPMPKFEIMSLEELQKEAESIGVRKLKSKKQLMEIMKRIFLKLHQFDLLIDEKIELTTPKKIQSQTPNVSRETERYTTDELKLVFANFVRRRMNDVHVKILSYKPLEIEVLTKQIKELVKVNDEYEEKSCLKKLSYLILSKNQSLFKSVLDNLCIIVK
ncbi:hypothetical protein SNEBB_008978 [Seison nebaliae]|nr:hypothetical protein SNEBB_008978 [Seison nebaliae]